jgi:hypothetical protein
LGLKTGDNTMKCAICGGIAVMYTKVKGFKIDDALFGLCNGHAGNYIKDPENSELKTKLQKLVSKPQ